MSKTIVLVFAAALLRVGSAAEAAPQCPPQLDGKLVQVQSAQPGWKGISATRFNLERATVVLGPPDIVARAELHGDEQRINKHEVRTLYSGLATEREKWIVCTYGQDGNVEQAYRLPDTVSQCAIKIALNRVANRNDVSISCK
jgi:hypothetical protein